VCFYSNITWLTIFPYNYPTCSLAPTENKTSESALVMMSTQSPAYLIWKFVCQLCMMVLGLMIFYQCYLLAYHNLSDPKNVNPGQMISQNCIGICFCSRLHSQTLKILRMVVRQPIKSFESPYCQFKDHGYIYFLTLTRMFILQIFLYPRN